MSKLPAFLKSGQSALIQQPGINLCPQFSWKLVEVRYPVHIYANYFHSMNMRKQAQQGFEEGKKI